MEESRAADGDAPVNARSTADVPAAEVPCRPYRIGDHSRWLRGVALASAAGLTLLNGTLR